MRRSWLLVLGVVVSSFGYSNFADAQPPGFGGNGGSGGSGGFGGFSRRGFSDEEMQRRFAEYDRDRDGKISYDEASDRTKPYFKTADANGDGGLDFGEYKGYISQRMSSFSFGGMSNGGPPSAPGSTSGPPGSSGISNSGGPPSFGGAPGFGGPPGFGGGPPPGFDFSRFSDRGRDDRDRGRDDRDRGRDSGSSEAEKAEIRAVAIRFGKLPENLPEWFKELDTDKDGQVALYEWRKGGKAHDEFTAIDLNADSLLTAEEWLRSERLVADKKKLDDLVAAAGGTPVSSSASSTDSEKSRDKSSSKSSKSSKSNRPDNPFSRK